MGDLTNFIIEDRSFFPLSLSGASFSSCGVYRRLLWRFWNLDKPVAVFGMLNPSTADAEKDDPTIKRCIKRSYTMNMGGLYVFNLFDVRATDPKIMLKYHTPCSPENDIAIKGLLTGFIPGIKKNKIGIVIAAWGNHGVHGDRERRVLDILKQTNHSVYHLGLTKEGHPRHPLHLAYSVTPQLWRK